MTGATSVEARMKDAGANAAITQGTLIMTSSDAKQWSCTSSSLAPKYHSAACR